MPKSKVKKPPAELTTDPDVIADIQRGDKYGAICDGFCDKGGHWWVTKKSLAAFRRKQEREAEEKLNRG